MKKILSLILTAVLLMAALAVPASATTVTPEAQYEIYLYIHVNGDASSPTKVADISDHTAIADDTLTMAETMEIVKEFFGENVVAGSGMFLPGGNAVSEVTGIAEARAQGAVTVHIYVTMDSLSPSAGSYVVGGSGAPGETVTLSLRLYDLDASSVGIKYTIPQGLEFVEGEWQLSDGLLSSVTATGAAFAWSETQHIDGEALTLTLRILDGAPVTMSVPVEFSVKDVDDVVYSGTEYVTVDVEYTAAGLTLSHSGCNIGVDGTVQLTAITDPEALADQVVWSSSDETVATVENGLVTGIGAGTAVITAQLDGYSCSCQVRVFENDGQAVTDACLFTGEPGCIRHIRCILNSMFH